MKGVAAPPIMTLMWIIIAAGSIVSLWFFSGFIYERMMQVEITQVQDEVSVCVADNEEGCFDCERFGEKCKDTQEIEFPSLENVVKVDICTTCDGGIPDIYEITYTEDNKDKVKKEEFKGEKEDMAKNSIKSKYRKCDEVSFESSPITLKKVKIYCAENLDHLVKLAVTAHIKK